MGYSKVEKVMWLYDSLSRKHTGMEVLHAGAKLVLQSEKLTASTLCVDNEKKRKEKKGRNWREIEGSGAR